MKRYFFILLLLSTTFPVFSQENTLIVFYNVENLFDIYDDPAIDDQEFLPGARIAWTHDRYDQKLANLAKVISSMKEEGIPSVIGLCEIENRKVLDDLVHQPLMKKGKYQVVHYDSPDERGIDVALIYRKQDFTVFRSAAIPVNLNPEFEDKTRDILYVCGAFKSAPQDTVHLFVNHWPSRSEGKAESEPKRAIAATTLRSAVDSLFALNKDARIILITPMQRVDFVYINNFENNAWGSYKDKNGQSLAAFAEAIKAIGKLEKFDVVDLYNAPELKTETLVKFKRLKDPQTGEYKNYPFPQFTEIPFNPKTDEYPYPTDAIDMTYDGLHPSDKGYRIIADMLIDILKAY